MGTRVSKQRTKAANDQRRCEAAVAAAVAAAAVTTRRQDWKGQDRKSRSRIDGGGPAERKRSTGAHRRDGKVIVLRLTGCFCRTTRLLRLVRRPDCCRCCYCSLVGPAWLLNGGLEVRVEVRDCPVTARAGQTTANGRGCRFARKRRTKSDTKRRREPGGARGGQGDDGGLEGSAGDEVVVVTRTGCGRWRAQQWRGVREENYGRDRDDRTETYSGMVAGRTVRLVENWLSFAVSRCLLFSRRERGWLAMHRSRGCKGAGLVAHVAAIQTVKRDGKGVRC